jgi:hypothetical protein
MVLLSTSEEPTVYGLGGSGGIPSKGNVVLTYPMAASSSVSKGDWVKLASTTAGTIERCSDTADNAIGVAFVDVDNSDGSASDKYCSVMRQGFAYVTGVIAGSGNTAGKAINFDDVLYLSATAEDNEYEGQTLTSTNGGTLVARALDAVTMSSTDTTTKLAKIRVYMDRLFKSTLTA